MENMSRKYVITQLKAYFSVQDLVCDHCYAKFGELSWQFLSTEILHTLLILRRDIFKVPMFVNYDGKHQRGLRCNICPLVKEKTYNGQIYLSAHVNGNGLDIDIRGYTAQQARDKIKSVSFLLPYKVRLEKGVNWLHIDVYDNDTVGQVSEFSG
jgi:hypothetical protein